jgi:histone-binding protein RBBP4
MCVDTSAFDPYIIVTGSNDNQVHVWDSRNLDQSLLKLESHTDQVTQTKFSPLQGNLLASSSSDSQVIVWDLASAESAVKFVHAGHQARVSDIAWNLNEKDTLASVSDDNIL